METKKQQTVRKKMGKQQSAETQTTKKGIIGYYGCSLNFSVINNELMMQNGAAITASNVYLDLDKPSYALTKSVDLSIFENQKHYYLYLDYKIQKNSGNYIIFTSLTRDIKFVVTEDKNEKMILLAEVDIDYDSSNSEGEQMLGIAKNSFVPQFNEIDIRQRDTIVFKQHIVSKEEVIWFAEPIYDLAHALQQKMKSENLWQLSTLAQGLFGFYESIVSGNLDYSQLYSKCNNYLKLFEWIDDSVWIEETQKQIEELKKIVFDKPQLYLCSLYQMDQDKQDGFFYCYRKNIIKLSKSVLRVRPAIANKEKILLHSREINRSNEPIIIPKDSDIIKHSNHGFEVVSSESFIIDDGTDNNHDIEENIAIQNPYTKIKEQEHHEETVLIDTTNTSQNSIQVGRGATCGNDIVLDSDDSSISRVHARITAYNQGFFIEDLSTMGIYIDGIQMGKHTKKFITTKNEITLGRRGCKLDLNHDKIKSLIV